LELAMERPKVFGIGFHKTGTSSLGRALEELGFRVTGGFGVHDPEIAEKALETAMRLIPDFDAFQDNPWPLLYRELDRSYPGSKFILTVRDSERWIESQLRHFGSTQTPMRQWIYGVGCPQGNEERYLSVYAEHDRAVRSYFAERSDDLLVMNLPGGDGWRELCPFLGVEIPDIPFFHVNQAEDREVAVSWWRRLLGGQRPACSRNRVGS
jgi:hypothetical protein